MTQQKTSRTKLKSPQDITPTTQKRTTLELLSGFWPIHNSELPKFFSISALMFCILFIQNVIRATKDSVINTMVGVESISFLKFWGVLPAAVIFALVYVKLVNMFKPETLFYVIISTFVGFFALFGIVIYPCHETLHLSKETANAFVASYPHLKWFILLAANWGFSLFYIIAELWPNAAFAVLFWQFVNGVSSVDQSKRFYPMFALFGQTGLFFSGYLLEKQKFWGTYLHNDFGLAQNSNIAATQFVMFVVTMFGLLSLFFFWFINRCVLETRANDLVKFKVEKKKKMSVLESFKFVASSRYIMLIAVMLTCYGLAINLVEGPWKAMATKMYTNPEDYSAFVGSYLKMTGILTLIFVLVGSNIVKWLGWYAAAIITPAMMFVTGVVFFYAANFQSEFLIGICIMIGYDPVMLAIVFGAIQNVVTKSTKYTLFDSTKEMAYVPLDDDLKVKGKGAVDSIGIKLGKSASAFIQMSIFFIFPNATQLSISPYLMVVFIAVCITWIWAVSKLGKEYESLVRK